MSDTSLTPQEIQGVETLLASPSKKPGPFQEADGAVSMRRILACFFALVAAGLGFVAASKGAEGAIAAYCAGGALIGALLLLFFTTWSDIALAVKSVKG